MSAVAAKRPGIVTDWSAQMQLKRAEVSLRAFPDHAKFYHAAYATPPPRADLQDHNRLVQGVYSADMSIDAK